MMMGKLLKGTSYPVGQYIEAFLITVGVAVFSIASKTPKGENSTELKGLVFLLIYFLRFLHVAMARQGIQAVR